MPLSDYTDYGSIRAALGVTVKELPDAMLEAALYYNIVKQELTKVDDTLPALVLTLNEKVSPTSAEEALLSSVSVYSAYRVAVICSDVMVNLIPRSVTSSKNVVMQHTDKMPLEALKALNRGLQFALKTLQDAFVVYSGSTASAATPMTLGVAATADYDPVIGE